MGDGCMIGMLIGHLKIKGRDAMKYTHTVEQLYNRYQDTDHPIAKMYWLDKLKERAACGNEDARDKLYIIDACSK